ncbi:MAG: LamG domain-containing protein, partial [Bacteroidia bacterium]
MRLIITCLLLFLSLISYGQFLVLPVEAIQGNNNMPHIVHEQAHITLKAVLFDNNPCGSGYTVHWDVNRNGNFDDDYSSSVTINSTSKFVEIGRTFLVPNVSETKLLNINGRVTNKCNSQQTYFTFRLAVLDWQPSSNPNYWTDEQVSVMSKMAEQEALWNLFRKMTSLSGNFEDEEAYSSLGSKEATAVGFMAFVNAGYLPAYYSSYSNYNTNPLNMNGMSTPSGFIGANFDRWYGGPYAEASKRLMNYCLNQLSVQSGIPSADEPNTCGYNNGTATSCSRVSGTNNNKGLYYELSGKHGGFNMWQGPLIAALSKSLLALEGTPAQLGTSGVDGKSIAYIIQELIDFQTYAQIDQNNGFGGFAYTADGGNHQGKYVLAEAPGWVSVGLQYAEKYGESSNVVVPNRLKYRMARNYTSMQNWQNGAWRLLTSSGKSKGAFIPACGMWGLGRWLGFQDFTSSSAKPYPNETSIQYSTLTTAYSYYTSYIQNNWSSNNHECGLGWNDRFWLGGDYLFGNNSDIYNAGRHANIYAMATFALAATSGNEPVVEFNGHNWVKEFTISLARQQDRSLNVNNPLSSYSDFGRVIETSCNDSTTGCGNNILATSWACLALNPHRTGNRPPTTSSFTTNLVAGQVHFFKAKDFAFNDADHFVLKEANWDNPNVYAPANTTIYGDHLTKIKIINLPSKGQLKLGNTLVSPNDEISAGNIGNLNYVAPAGKASGTNFANFSFKVSDGTEYSETKTCTINLDEYYQPNLGAGNALKLENDYDGIKLPTGTVSGTYTLDFWIKPTGFTNGVYSFTNNKYHIFNRIFVDNAYKLAVYNGSSYSTTSSGLSANKWNHVAMANDGTSLIVYINGIVAGTFSSATFYELDSRSFIGNNKWPSVTSFKGELDEVRLWNIKMSQSLVRDYMCKKATASDNEYSNLVTWYSFNAFGNTMADEINGSRVATTQSGNYNWTEYLLQDKIGFSSAPVGESSAHSYSSSSNPQLAGSNGETLTLKNFSGTFSGVHLVNSQQPVFDQLPNQTVSKSPSKYQVFSFGTSSFTYSVDHKIPTSFANYSGYSLNGASEILFGSGTFSRKSFTSNSGTNTYNHQSDILLPVLINDQVDEPGYVLDFDGTNDYVLLNSSPIGTDNSFTIETWIWRSPSATSYGPIYCESVSGRSDTRNYLFINNDKLAFDQWPNAGGYLGSSTSLEKGKWYHVAYVQDGTSRKIYLNGLLENSDNSAETYHGYSPGQIRIGSRGGTSVNYWKGRIEEFRIWDDARTAAEILEHMNNPINGAETGLKTYVKFNGNVNDQSGNHTLSTQNFTMSGTSSNYVKSDAPVFASDLSGLIGGGNALHFDGENDKVDCGADLSVGGRTTFSAEAWIKGDSWGQFNTVLSEYKTWTGDLSYILRVEYGKLYGFVKVNGNVKKVGPSANLDQNKWYHVALTYDNIKLRLYVNGTLVDDKSATGAISGCTGNNIIGSSNYGISTNSEFFNGTIDEVRLWKTARTANQIKANMHKSLTTGFNDLIGLYQLNEGSSTTAHDQSHYSNNARLSNFLLSGNTSNWVQSTIPLTSNAASQAISGSGYALEFDGSNDWVYASGNSGSKTSASSINLPTRNITIEAWVKPDRFRNWDGIVSFLQDNGSFERGWDLEVRNGNKLAFALAGTASSPTLTYLETANTFSTGDWVHVAGTYDGTIMKIYVNGILEASSIAQSGDISYADSWLAIGSYRDDNENNVFDGRIDEVRIWNVTRTAMQIQDNLHKSLKGSETGLVAYFPFDQTSGTTSDDNSTNGLTATLSNFSGIYWVDATDREPFKTIKAGNVSNSGTWKGGSSPSASTDKLAVFHDLTLSSGTQTFAELNVTSGNKLTHNGRINVTGNVIVNGQCSGSNTIHLNGSSKQTLSGSGNLGVLNVNNSNDIELKGDITIDGTLQLTSGDIELGDNDLTLGGSTSNGSSSSYIKVNGTGKVKTTVGSSPITIPIGRNPYLPVTLNDGGNEEYAIGISENVYANPENETSLQSSNVVGETWTIQSSASQNNVSVTLQWDASEEETGFNRSTSFLNYWENGVSSSWNTGSSMSASGSGPYSLTRTVNFSTN